MNIVLPAEANLDLYKAAYVIFKERNMRLTNLTIAYPTKSFAVGQLDICLGMDIIRENQQGKNFSGFEDVMKNAVKNSTAYAFLRHIPESVMYCFREFDKTILAWNIFQAFDNFAANMKSIAEIPDKTTGRVEYHVGGYRILCAPTGDTYLTPEDRIILFRSGYHYIVFASGNTVGVQKSLIRHIPALTDFAKDMGLDPVIWFTHRMGHLVISKNNRTPNLSPEEMCELLAKFLVQKNEAADAVSQQ